MKSLSQFLIESQNKNFASIKSEIVKALGLRPKDVGNSPNNRTPKFKLQLIKKDTHNAYAKLFDNSKITVLLNSHFATPEEFKSSIKDNLDKLNDIEGLTYTIIDAKKYQELFNDKLDSDVAKEFDETPDILISVTK